MQQGSLDEALALAKQRWAAQHPFDLAPETWETLFAKYRATDLLEAIKKTRGTRDTKPEGIYESLLYWLNRLEQQRAEKTTPTWPPPDVARN